jgi:hypothetical protein
MVLKRGKFEEKGRKARGNKNWDIQIKKRDIRKYFAFE